MATTEPVTISLPIGLADRARKVGINVSATSAAAIEKSVIALENISGENDG